MNSVRLRDKVIVVTGATGRAGRDVVSQLHFAGAELVLVGRDVETLQALAAQHEPQPAIITADLDDQAEAIGLFDDISVEYGQIDGVVHLVGGWAAGGVESFDPALAEKMWRQLVLTTANVTTAVRASLQASGGRFIAIGSTATERPSSQNALYSSAKAGAAQWVKALAAAFEGTEAAAYSFDVMALYTLRMQQNNPERDWTGWTRTDRLADSILSSFDKPYTNGTTLIP